MNKQDNRFMRSKLLNAFLKKGRWRDILLMGILGFALVFVTWKLFADDQTEETFSGGIATQTEEKVSRLLTEIDGVGNAEVMICETEEGVQSVVVVCDGARDFKVVMTIREAVAAALGTEEKTIKIYQKKE